jgi:hypothetical protein
MLPEKVPAMKETDSRNISRDLPREGSIDVGAREPNLPR